MGYKAGRRWPEPKRYVEIRTYTGPVYPPPTTWIEAVVIAVIVLSGPLLLWAAWLFGAVPTTK